MGNFLRVWLFCAFLLTLNCAEAKENPRLDVRWKVVSQNDSIVFIRLSLKSNTEAETLGNANFIFDYDEGFLSFAKNVGDGINNYDCFWYKGFETTDTSNNAICTVTKIHTGQLSININLEPGFAVPISSDTSYTAVIDMKFRILKPKSVTRLNLIMDKTKPPTFDNVFDDNFIPFDEGEGWDKPLILKL
jgi:hypothetical protein